MPWKETDVSDERIRFVLACGDDEDSMAALCRRYGISRRAGYKWLSRYRDDGPSGLTNQSRAPHRHPNQVEAEVERKILAMRSTHPTWGARKLLARLAREKDLRGIVWPAASTVGQILKRAGLIVPRRHKAHRAAPPGPAMAVDASAPNRLWCADFKGWFRTGDGSRCDPLTISDAHSRYLLRCQTAQINYTAARGLFEATFREFGLPEAIRTDNGEPFASVGLLGLSRLSVWWIRLGIAHDRIDPGCPQQNGSHERMHGTLKRQTANPPARTLRAQQNRFDAFCQEYNQQRPHEGLPGMATPGSVYAPSLRSYPERLAEWEYPPDHQTRRVDDSGKFTWEGQKVWLGKVLSEQTIGLRPLEQISQGPERYWNLRLGPIDLGLFDSRHRRLLNAREQRHVISETRDP